MDGASYQLAQNNSAGHSIHGGVEGFDKRVWAATAVATAAYAGVAFEYVSHDCEEGFPGTRRIKAEYRLWKDSNKLTMEFTAGTDKATVRSGDSLCRCGCGFRLFRVAQTESLAVFSRYCVQT